MGIYTEYQGLPKPPMSKGRAKNNPHTKEPLQLAPLRRYIIPRYPEATDQRGVVGLDSLKGEEKSSLEGWLTHTLTQYLP